jgi:hypothetical protein
MRKTFYQIIDSLVLLAFGKDMYTNYYHSISMNVITQMEVKMV